MRAEDLAKKYGYKTGLEALIDQLINKINTLNNTVEDLKERLACLENKKCH